MTTQRPKIEYVLFDMDGLMIDSEQVYTNVTNSILSRYGKEMTWNIKAGCMGKPELEASKYLLSFFPDISLTLDDYIRERREKQDLFWPTVQPMPGIMKLVQHLVKHKVPIAVATGSQRRNFVLKTTHLPELFGLFEGRVMCGDDPAVAGKGKPAPDVFLASAGLLGRDVGRGDVNELGNDADGQRHKAARATGLVFEDATNGVEAAKRAGMNGTFLKAMLDLVPPKELAPEEDLGADAILGSLEDFKPEEWGLPPYDA